jgi:hypothetical protein
VMVAVVPGMARFEDTRRQRALSSSSLAWQSREPCESELGSGSGWRSLVLSFRIAKEKVSPLSWTLPAKSEIDKRAYLPSNAATMIKG